MSQCYLNLIKRPGRGTFKRHGFNARHKKRDVGTFIQSLIKLADSSY